MRKCLVAEKEPIKIPRECIQRVKFTRYTINTFSECFYGFLFWYCTRPRSISLLLSDFFFALILYRFVSLYFWSMVDHRPHWLSRGALSPSSSLGRRYFCLSLVDHDNTSIANEAKNATASIVPNIYEPIPATVLVDKSGLPLSFFLFSF